MTTELDMYALRQMTPIGCAQRLTELSRAELWAICDFLGLRVPRKAEKVDLVGQITSLLHPLSSTPSVAAEGQQQQLSLF